MSASTTRRNGALASCEPCRERKTRCDHKKPICASCQRRGLDSRCYYHPAPLTKDLNAVTLPRHASPSWNRNIAKGSQSNTRRHAARIPEFQAWPFMSIISKDSSPHTPTVGSYDGKNYDAHLSTMKEIVSQLKYLPTIERFLHQYYSFKKNALVPKQVLLPLFEMLRNDLVSSCSAHEEDKDLLELNNLSKLSEQVLYSSSTEVIITSSLDLHGFLALFYGTNLRVETIGLFYTMAARVSLLFVDCDKKKDEVFIRDMVWYSKLSLQLARDLAPQSNDLIVWLANENAQLVSFLEGDASLAVWRLVGDLATDLLALGLHREATYSPEKTPFFLAECRRRCFVTAYYMEKMFGMVFNLPPRITFQYVDIKLPLDLSDDELFVDTPEKLDEVKGRLTEDGWNTDGNYRAATWARLRYILSQFREEMVEYQFQTLQATDPLKLRDLSCRCRQAWDNLLPHLRYNQDCWKSEMPLPVCYMQAKVHLAYLQIHFQIYQLLGKEISSFPELLDVSINILETALHIGSSRSKGTFTFSDLPEILLCCGLPSAAVLFTALENITLDPSRSLPPGIKTSVLIRNLSLLAAQLESSASPRESNQAFCLQAAKAIMEKLDIILDRFTTSDSLSYPKVSTGNDLTPVSNFTPSIGSHEMNTINLEDYEDFDLVSWAINVDLGNTASDWMV